METGSGDLIRDASRGDSEALDALLVRYLPELRSFLRLRLGARILARESEEDILQSVCREVLQDLPVFEYRGEPAFKRWLFLTAERKVKDRGRFHASEKRTAEFETAYETEHAEISYDSFVSPSRIAMGREQVVRFEQAFDSLPEEYRQVLTSAKILGMPHEDIASETGKSVGAVRMVLCRALAKLGRMLEEGEG